MLFCEVSARLMGAMFQLDNPTRVDNLSRLFQWKKLDHFILDYLINMHDVDYCVELIVLCLLTPELQRFVSKARDKIRHITSPSSDDPLWKLKLSCKWRLLHESHSQLMRGDWSNARNLISWGYSTVTFRHLYEHRIETSIVYSAPGTFTEEEESFD